jgi:ribonuclease VapC
VIVDSSAILTILLREPEEAAFRAALESGSAKMSAGTLIELRVVAIRFAVRAEVEALMAQYAISVVPVDSRQADIAAAAFAKFGKGRHTAGLNLGDLFAYALASAHDEPLLFKGNDFTKTDVKRAI